MKKFIAIMLAVVMFGTFIAGCGSTATGTDTQPAAAPAAATEPSTQPQKIKIVTTIFPEYDWVREVLGDKAGNADLTMLLDNGIDLHSYQPTADDIVKISDCDLFIYVGGESDG